MSGEIDSEKPGVPEVSAGERLRAARERAGISIEDVASKLKLSVRQISAIEKEDWSALPERTFTRGFFRSYARLVDVDEASIDTSFAQQSSVGEMRTMPPGIGEVSADNTPARGVLSKWGIPLALAGCLIAGLAWFLLYGSPLPKAVSRLPIADVAKVAANQPVAQQNASLPQQTGQVPEKRNESVSDFLSKDTNVQGGLLSSAGLNPSLTLQSVPGERKPGDPAAVAAPSATPMQAAAASPPTPTPAPAIVTTPLATLPATADAPKLAPGQKRINLVVTGRSWTEVRSRGEVVSSETLSDTSREYALKPPLFFVLGNASNVALTIDGKPFDFSMHVRNEVARFRIE